MREVATLGIFGLLACTSSEKSINTTNDFPEAHITSHSNGDQVSEGIVTLFTGAVSDTNNASSELLVTWYEDTEILCPETPPESDATTRCEAAVSAGINTITLAVRDPDDARADHTISVVVVETEAPNAEITSPDGSETYYADQLITFEGLISDTEDDDGNLTAYWTSSLDGDLTAVDAHPNSNGEVSGFGNLTAGEHAIELHVEDSTGKTNKDSIIITVEPANTPPSCEILTPVPNSAGTEGMMVNFQGQVSDPDSPANELEIAWSSDKDGEIGNSTPDGSGAVDFPYDGLSLNTHVVSMTVTDERGEQCVANVVYTVGSAPSIILTSPTQSDIYDEGASISFVAEVSDSEDPPEQIQLSWESSLDGVFSTTSAASNGIAQFNVNSLNFGIHDITVTATDSTGLYAQALVQITVNGLPSQPTVSLNPNPAYSDDDLTSNATGSVDPEGAAVTYTYEWFLNGSNTGNTGSTLPFSATNKGDNWTVRATPTDGITTGQYAEASITISNALPEVQSVSIIPSVPSTQDDLTCTPTTYDADGDTVTVIYEWTMNGNIQSSTTNLLPAPFQQGDSITCTVTPNDGTTSGSSLSDAVTITNTPPVLSSLTLSPSVIYTNDYITATASASDPDGDPLSYSWTWYVDDGSGFTQAQISSTSMNSDSLDGVYHFERDDLVYVDLEVSDGNTITSQASSQIQIANTPPSAFNVLITPSDPVAGLDDLECIAQGSDSDGDSITFSYSWTVDGNTTSYTTDTISNADIADAEVWVCTVTPYDQTDYGTANSATVTVGADIEGAVGGIFCASAGQDVDSSGYQITSCLSETGVAGEETTDSSSYTLQPGSIFLFSPE